LNTKKPTTAPFAEDFARLRESRGLSFRQLAALTRRLGPGLSAGYLSHLASGHEEPVPDAIEKVAGALGVEPTHFAEYRFACARAALDERGEGGFAGALAALAEIEALPPTKRRIFDAPPVYSRRRAS
jgi:transcriptional regulator with XRE-family HTH domain